MLYFAYGSKMDPAQMRTRRRNSEVVGNAAFQGHECCFPRLSNRRGWGLASVNLRAGMQTWGFLYQLTPEDTDALDASEGCQVGRDTSLNSYNRVEVSVLVDGVANIVSTYVAVPQDDPTLPNLAYMTHLRIGAGHHRLPEEYIALLDLVERQ